MDQRTILIVDDDAPLAEVLSEAFESEVLEVIVCSDTEAAELVLERMPVDMVLSDVMLSGPFGFEGLDFVKYVHGRDPSTRVVLMTGCADTALKSEALARGAFAVLQKPFPLSEMFSMFSQ